ncbi:hypothetical protein GCM10028784_30350 [Myceligenerans cantabricum]
MTRRKLRPGDVGEVSYREIPLKGTGARGKSVWQARVRVCLYDGSEEQPGRNADTKTEARNRVLKAATDLLSAPRGSEALKPDSRVGLACRQWINELRVRQAWPNPPVRPQTVDEYERNLGRHVVPHLGKRRLRELTPAIIQAWIDGMIERGKDGPHDMVTTTAATRGNLISVLDRAVVHDALRDNPARKTQAPSKKRPEPKAMTVFGIGRLRAAVRSWERSREGQPGPRPTGHLPAVVDVMLGTGMRIGEVMALRWGEVNLSPDGLPTIAVEATLTDVKGQGTVRQPKPKTDAGDRVIILPPFVAEALVSIRPAVTTADMPVFPSRRFRDGRNATRAQTPHNIRRTLRMALDKAEMTGEVYPHLLRKTVATRVARKMRLADAAALLGHKIDAGVTARHYIDRLRLAPDTSAVLQEMVEIGDAEYQKSNEETRVAGSDTDKMAHAAIGAVEDSTGW